MRRQYRRTAQRATTTIALSKWFEDKGDLARALTEMKNALKYNETSAAVRIEMAALLDQMGRSREALDEAQEAARIDPGNPEPHWVLANLYFRSQARDRSGRRESLNRAVHELEQMRQDAPEDERAYYALGGAYFELGETEKGIQAFEKFQDLAPNVDAGYVAIARNYERSGNLDKAIEYLQKAIKSQPESSESMMMLASLYSRQNRHKEAIPIYAKILELSNDNPAVRKQFGATLVEAGEYDEAQRVLAELAKATPDDKDVQVLLGRTYLGQRQYAQSIEAFRSVLNSDSGQVEAQYYLGVAYEQSGNPAEAAKVFSNLVTKAREGSEEYKANRMVFQQHLAAAYQDMGENDKAIALYEEMVKSAPDASPRLYFLLINAYRVNRQLDKALNLGKQQLAKDPDDVNIALVYARALADSGKTREGADLLAKDAAGQSIECRHIRQPQPGLSPVQEIRRGREGSAPGRRSQDRRRKGKVPARHGLRAAEGLRSRRNAFQGTAQRESQERDGSELRRLHAGRSRRAPRRSGPLRGAGTGDRAEQRGLPGFTRLGLFQAE